MAQQVPGCDSVRGMLERLYNHTRIASRYMAVPDFSPDQCLKGDDLFFPDDHTFQVGSITQAQVAKKRLCDTGAGTWEGWKCTGA